MNFTTSRSRAAHLDFGKSRVSKSYLTPIPTPHPRPTRQYLSTLESDFALLGPQGTINGSASGLYRSEPTSRCPLGTPGYFLGSTWTKPSSSGEWSFRIAETTVARLLLSEATSAAPISLFPTSIISHLGSCALSNGAKSTCLAVDKCMKIDWTT